MVIKFKQKPITSPIPKVYTCNHLPASVSIIPPTGTLLKWWDGNTNKTRTFADTGWHTFIIYNSCFTISDSAYTGYHMQNASDPVTTINICFEDDTTIFLTAKKRASYLWRPGNFNTQSIQAKKYGWYSVQLTDSAGCMESDSFQIVKSCATDTLLIPNAFSPNADGKNDIFKPSYVRHVNYELRIYDRWGELMFKSNDIYEGWDGKFKSKPSAEDVYIYYIEVSGFGIFRQRKGTLHLVR